MTYSLRLVVRILISLLMILNYGIEIDNSEPILVVITHQDIIDAVTHEKYREEDDDDEIGNDTVMKDDIPHATEVI